MDMTLLSEKAQEILKNWKTNNRNVNVDRINWDEYYIKLAFEVSTRSIDSQTHCGCVITNRLHQPLGFGYNSFVRDIDDTILPNTRPEKYPFMIHSELNAIFNCTIPPINGIAYITGPPCPHCLQCLWQVGIKEIVFADNYTHMQQETGTIEEILIELLRERGLIYRKITYVRDKNM